VVVHAVVDEGDGKDLHFPVYTLPC
jgi:hypothetical protein